MNNCASNWWIAILAVAIVVVFNIWGKGMFKIIPILLGVVGSYLVAALCGQVDFTKVHEAAWIGLPFDWKDTTFSLMGNADGSLVASAIAMMMPIALATMMEHIGDMCAISSTVEQNFIADPGLHRSLLGDGLATIAGCSVRRSCQHHLWREYRRAGADQGVRPPCGSSGGRALQSCSPSAPSLRRWCPVCLPRPSAA